MGCNWQDSLGFEDPKDPHYCNGSMLISSRKAPVYSNKISTKWKGVTAWIYILRDIDIELWSKVKAKAPLERKTMREVIFEGLKWYLKPTEIANFSERKREGRAIKEGMALVSNATMIQKS